MASFVSAKDAVKHIKSGDRVVIAHACAEPQAVVKAMVDNASNYKDVEIVHMVAMGSCEYTKEKYKDNFRHNALFVGGGTRKAIEDGRADYTPCFFFEIPRLFKNDILAVDVALISLSPPDRFGFCSTGVAVDYTMAAAKKAKILIAQINDKLPRTGGESLIHIDDVDYAVEISEDIIELASPKITEIEAMIGDNCARLVKDGATLQLGIGAIPDALLDFLNKKKDLGIHTEMFSDGVVKLVEKGVVNNKAKSLHKDFFVASFLMGSKILYDFVDENPMVKMLPVDYVNHPAIISKNSLMTSINSAVQVDLMGQVNAESVGSTQISGTGGQVDFLRGTSLAKDAKSIIALPSVASKKNISKIVFSLDEGAAVTSSRNDVHYIVTEYGIADLRGKSLRDRAKSLIAIAHPDYREELSDKAKQKFKKF